VNQTGKRGSWRQDIVRDKRYKTLARDVHV